jgi:hypothetical protein
MKGTRPGFVIGHTENKSPEQNQGLIFNIHCKFRNSRELPLFWQLRKMESTLVCASMPYPKNGCRPVIKKKSGMRTIFLITIYNIYYNLIWK